VPYLDSNGYAKKAEKEKEKAKRFFQIK